MQLNFEYIASQATETKNNWSNLNKLRFHYFNPNGLCEKKRQLDEKISNAVNLDKVPSGVLFVHGSLNDFCITNICSLMRKNRITNRHTAVALEMVQNAINKATSYLEQEVAA